MIASTDDFRWKLRDYLDAVQMSETQVIVQRYRKPVAVLVNYEQWQRLQQQVAGQGKSNEAK